MAGSGQGGAAYGRLNPNLQGLASVNMQAAGQAKQETAQLRAMDYQEEQRRKARAQKKADSMAAKGDQELKYDLTGQSTLDDVMVNSATGATDLYGEYTGKYEEALANGDEVKAREYLNKSNKILRSFDAIKQGVKLTADSYNKVKEDFLGGKISGMDYRAMSAYESIENMDVIVKTDSDGNIRYYTMAEGEEGGDKKLKEFTLQDLKGGWMDPIKKIDLSGRDGLINKFLVTRGKKRKTTEDGKYIITSSVWTPKDEIALKSEIQGVISNDRAMADLLYQASGSTIKKYEGFTPGDYEKVVDFIYNNTRAAMDSEYSKRTNYAKLNYNRGLAADARADKKLKQDEAKNKNKNRVVATKVVTPEGDTFTKVSSTGSGTGTWSKGAQTKGTVFTLSRPDGKPVTGVFKDPLEEIKSIEVREDGTYWAQSAKPKAVRAGSTSDGGMAVSEKKYRIKEVELSPGQMTNLATKMGYNSTKELVDSLKGETSPEAGQGNFELDDL